MSNYNMDCSPGGAYHYPQDRSELGQRMMDPYQQHHSLSQAMAPMHSSAFAPSQIPRYLQSEYSYSRGSSSNAQTPHYEEDNDKRTEKAEESLPPEMETLITDIMTKFKSKGTFDRFRRECLSDIDTKPAYINLTTRVNNLVNSYLKKITWTPAISKVKIRESMRKYMTDARFFDRGVDRVVDQVVNPKVNSIFFPLVEEEVYNFLGIEKPKDFYDEEDDNVDVEGNDTEVDQDVKMLQYPIEDMDISYEGQNEAAAEPEQFKRETISQSDYGKSVPREKVKLGQWIPIPDATESASSVCFPKSNSDNSRTESDLLNLPASPRSPVEEEEPLPPGEEREIFMPNNEALKCEANSPDYGVAHTPEDEYDENLIKEREELYFNSNSCGNSPNPIPTTIPTTEADEKSSTKESMGDDVNVTESENEQEDYVSTDEEEDDEEEESPPFEKIGDSPPPSPKKSISAAISNANDGKVEISHSEKSTEPKPSQPNSSDEGSMENTVRSVSEESAVGKIAEENTVSSDAEENAISSDTEENAAGSVAEENAVGSVAKENTVSSVAEENDGSSVAEENAVSSVAEENAVSSFAEENTVSSVAEENAASSSAEENAVSSAAEENDVSSAAEENDVSSIAEEKAVSSAAVEDAVSNVAEENPICTDAEEDTVSKVDEITEDIVQTDGKENEDNKEVAKPTIDLTEKGSKVHIPEDVEDTPVFFLEPIPSLVEKSEFYQQFRTSVDSSDNESSQQSK